MDNKHTKRHSISLVIKEKHTKIIEILLHTYYNDNKKLKLKKLALPNDGKILEQLEPLPLADGNVKWYSSFEKLSISYKVKSMLITQQPHSLVI